jgi:UDP-galactopyranose mutase
LIPEYTRIIEHRYFRPDINYSTLEKTVITYEYPEKWEIGKERYYPISNDRTLTLYNKYVDYLNKQYPNIQLGGRLGLYKYVNMDETIKLAMVFCSSVNNKTLYYI